MLKIIEKLDDLDIGQLMRVCEDSNHLLGRNEYRNLPDNLQILYAEQDFYAYLQSFFEDKDASYAVWAPEGVYKAVLRIERYRDGFIVTGLETAPEDRRKGYATMLLRSVVDWLKTSGQNKLYSHIEKTNLPSIQLHRNIGFCKISDSAIYIDGTFHMESATYCLEM